MKEFVVFYAWQSDTEPRFNRHFIRAALDLAAKAISADATIGVSVRIDADTEGVLGHVPVTDTLLKKIAACNAFVPDLTFVAKTRGGKLVPNPNVLLEYGYALRAKSYSLMIPVMNSAYGPPEQLPFDMGHLRHPLQFDLPETAANADRRAARKALTEEFQRILRLMIADALALPGEETPFPEADAVGSPAFYFPRGATIAEFGNPGEQEYKFEGENAVYLRLFPKRADGQPRVGRATLKALFYEQRAVNPMAVTHGGLVSRNDYGWVSIDPASNTLTKAITQGFPTGELWGVNSQVFVAATYNRHIAPAEAITALGIISAEKICARSLEQYVSFATEKLNLRFPFTVVLGAVGLKGVYMGAPHPEAPGGHYYGPFRDASLIRRYELHDGNQASLFDVLRQYFEELYDLADCSRSVVLTDEYVRLNRIPPRYSA
jgi:hypothetical protein